MGGAMWRQLEPSDGTRLAAKIAGCSRLRTYHSKPGWPVRAWVAFHAQCCSQMNYPARSEVETVPAADLVRVEYYCEGGPRIVARTMARRRSRTGRSPRTTGSPRRGL